MAYKKALTEKLDLALIYDQPYGADVKYAKNYPLSWNPVAGGRQDVLRAEADFDAITALMRYKFDGGVSAIGGLRIQKAKASIAVPAVNGYEVDTDSDVGVGYVLGVAWEKPEIAARVALTYNSKITHDWSQTESLDPLTASPPLDTESQFETPQSVNLDFQTGVAPRTLLFGSIRWADWPQLVYAPPVYVDGRGKNLVDYQSDTFTYSLGMGYKFNDAFSGAVTLGYEASKGLPTSNLGPTDGSWSVGLGGTYNVEKAKISGGIRYTEIGDAVTNTGGVFTGNSAWSAGLQVTYALN
ncbi:MAG: outer membrane protein transport protein [Ruegeria sp.]